MRDEAYRFLIMRCHSCKMLFLDYVCPSGINDNVQCQGLIPSSLLMFSAYRFPSIHKTITPIDMDAAAAPDWFAIVGRFLFSMLL